VELEDRLGGATSRTLLTLGSTYFASNRFPESIAFNRRAEERANAAGDVVAALRARIGIDAARLFADPEAISAGIEREARTAIETLERLGDDRALVDAWTLVAVASLSHARWEDVATAYERTLHYARRSDARLTIALVPSWTASSYVWGPMPAETALARIRTFLAEAKSRRAIAVLHRQEGTLLGLLGELDKAVQLHAQAQAEFAEIGLTDIYGEGMVEALVLVENGDHEGAIRWMRAGREKLLAAGETGTRSTLEARLGMSLAWLGRDEEALEWSRSGEAISSPDDAASQVDVRLGRALAFAHLGRRDEAVALIDEAEALAMQTQGLILQAEVPLIEGEIHRFTGDHAAARAAWERALERYERKQIRPTIARIRGWLADLPA
jgi:tetratricopeptide (TPR) repeat protein